MKLLNLGCGHRFHPSWTNMDFTSTGEGVIAHNLNLGLPFPDNSFDVVYNSHVLEHFTKIEAESFIKECYRVLRLKGIIRVVVPDLENIARIYLTALEKINSGCQEWKANYEWILLEMYDQTVRNKSGGGMKEYLFQEKIDNQEFVFNRMGIEAKKMIESGKCHREKYLPSYSRENQLKQSLKHIYRFLRYPRYRRETLIRQLLGDEHNALEIGRFRQRGEIHQWMYDYYSLSTLLQKCGLEDIVRRSARESYIPSWTSYNLDTEPDETVYKPNSLFIEGIKN